MKRQAEALSTQAQVDRMKLHWPDLLPLSIFADGSIAWIGPLRGFQLSYRVEVRWHPARFRPLVFVRNPAIRPRPGGRFLDIPHLIYRNGRPEESALCLFDPEQDEWRSTMWIAETIVPWASEWLYYYEFWHLDGIWRGANALGPISVGAGTDRRPAKELEHVQGT